MVSGADLMQALQGVRYPATKEEMLGIVDGKRETGLFEEAELRAIEELLETVPDGKVFRNQGKALELLGATHKGLQAGAVYMGNPDALFTANRRDAPLGFGELEPDIGLAERAAQVHEEFREPEPVARKGGASTRRNFRREE